jgi:hypothetical protein
MSRQSRTCRKLFPLSTTRPESGTLWYNTSEGLNSSDLEKWVSVVLVSLLARGAAMSKGSAQEALYSISPVTEVLIGLLAAPKRYARVAGSWRAEQLMAAPQKCLHRCPCRQHHQPQNLPQFQNFSRRQLCFAKSQSEIAYPKQRTQDKGSAIQQSQFRQGINRLIRIEGSALLTAAFVFAGATSFIIILQKVWNIEVEWGWLLALVATMFTLPKTFSRLARSKAPLTIKAATAFQGGFVALQAMVPDLTNWVTKMRIFWKNIHRSL